MSEKVKNILLDYTEFPVNEMRLETELVKDLGLNSLDIVNIALTFEEEFEIEIPDRVIGELKTVGDIVSFLENQV